MPPTSPSPSKPAPALRKRGRWWEAIIALIVLAGFIALGVFGPDRSHGGDVRAAAASTP